MSAKPIPSGQFPSDLLPLIQPELRHEPFGDNWPAITGYRESDFQAWSKSLENEPLENETLPIGVARCKPGDLLAFYGTEFVSRAIQARTLGPSHVAIVCDDYDTPENGPICVESTTLCPLPCLFQGKPVSGVQAHRVVDRVNQYTGAIYRVPLTKGWEFDVEEGFDLWSYLKGWIGKSYDLDGAFVSASPFDWLFYRLVKYPDAGSIFCSALCAVAMAKMNRFPLTNPYKWTPAGLIRKARRITTYGKPELIK